MTRSIEGEHVLHILDLEKDLLQKLVGHVHHHGHAGGLLSSKVVSLFDVSSSCSQRCGPVPVQSFTEPFIVVIRQTTQTVISSSRHLQLLSTADKGHAGFLYDTLFISQLLKGLEGTARYAGLLLAPAEGFSLRPRLFLLFGQKKGI